MNIRIEIATHLFNKVKSHRSETKLNINTFTPEVESKKRWLKMRLQQIKPQSPYHLMEPQRQPNWRLSHQQPETLFDRLQHQML